MPPKKVGARQSWKLGRLVNERADVVGMRAVGAFLALKFVACWGLFMDEQGREPVNVEELVAWRPDMPDVSTAYRWQRDFRRLFPEYRTPGDLWKLTGGQVVTHDDPSTATYELGASELPPELVG